MRLLRMDRADVIFHGSFILQAVAAHEGYMVLPSHKEKMDPIKIISYGHKEDGSISKVIALQHEDLSSNSQNQQKSQSCGLSATRWEVKTRRPLKTCWPARQGPRPLRDGFSNKRWKVSED